MKEFRKSLREIVGHEPPDCVPWEKEGKPVLTGRGVKDFWEWLSIDLQEIVNSLCFLDLTLCNIDRTQFYGVLITPDESRSQQYKQVLKKVNTSNNQVASLGTHEVFLAGLPTFDHSTEGYQQTAQATQPQTLDELRKCIRSKFTAVSDGYFSWIDESIEAVISGGSEIEKVLQTDASSFHCVQVKSSDFGLSDDPRIFKENALKASDIPVQKRFETLLEHLRGAKAELTNIRSETLSAIFAIPLCSWFYTDYQNYTPVAQIFIGLSGQNAQRDAFRIAERVALYAFRSIGASRADLIGSLRSRGNISHRLPGTLHSMILSLEKQKEKLQISLEIPPQFYVLYMVASLQRGLLPRWQVYEERCKQGAQFIFAPEIIEKMWAELAVPIGLSRVQLDSDPRFRQQWNQVPEPCLHVKQGNLIMSNAHECSVVLSFCCPLLIEAFQHALMWSVLEKERTGESKRAQVEVCFYEDEIVIINPAHEPRPSEQISLNMGVQKTEIGEIERLGRFVWIVEFPNPDSLKHGDIWTVKIRKSDKDNNE